MLLTSASGRLLGAGLADAAGGVPVAVGGGLGAEVAVAAELVAGVCVGGS